MQKKVAFDFKSGITHQLSLKWISFHLKETTPPQAASRRIEEYEIEDEYGAKDCNDLELKPDHQNRPLWIVIKNLK